VHSNSTVSRHHHNSIINQLQLHQTISINIHSYHVLLYFFPTNHTLFYFITFTPQYYTYITMLLSYLHFIHTFHMSYITRVCIAYSKGRATYIALIYWHLYMYLSCENSFPSIKLILRRKIHFTEDNRIYISCFHISSYFYS
jgi:hypothetical protein